jgi:beta-galactosidase
MRIASWIALIAAWMLTVAPTTASAQGRRVQSLDADWRFILGDPHDAAVPTFDDQGWRRLNVPHDWSIEGEIRQDSSTGPGGAFLPAGIGWYRKTFVLPPSERSQRVWVEFDGVMANSEVWINGFALGKRPNGYVGFRFELTGHLHFGQNSPNLLAVRADNGAQPASRWYAGAGIYRHVRLVVTDTIALQPDSLYVTTPRATTEQATVRIQCAIENRSAAPAPISVRIALFDAEGKTQATVESGLKTAAVGKTLFFSQEITVPQAKLWSVAHPALYRAVVTILDDKRTRDRDSAVFGIREARFEPATGFWLNGRNLKIKGVCLHQEAGALGMAVPRSVWERRLSQLKAFGVNAIRAAHTPFSPEFLGVCDRLGLLVVDEMFDCWTVGKTPYDYHLVFKQWAERDARATVLRDRNHPSVILYSIGNEIHDTPKAALAKGILTTLRDVVHTSDPTRPVTQALFRPNASHDYDNGLADLLDVIGQNYRENEILAAHRDKPERRIIGTENGHDRRIWLALRDHPAYAGQFLWTGIDYLGEAKRWPAISADHGLFDRTLVPKPRGYERRSWWSDLPMVAIARRVAFAPATPTDPGYELFQAQTPTVYCDWTPLNRAAHVETVEVYSNCEQVELFLNDNSLGTLPRPADASARVWKVAFAPGILRAVGRNGVKEAAVATLRTAGKPARIVLTSDRAGLLPDWEEVGFVTATITDVNGVTVPDATDKITFHVTGPGAIAGVDNGSLTSHESFRATARQAYAGQCLAIVRATASSGQITLRAEARGLSAATVILQAIPRLSASTP